MFLHYNAANHSFNIATTLFKGLHDLTHIFAPVSVMEFGTGVSSVEAFFHCCHPSALSWFCVSSPHPVRANEPDFIICSNLLQLCARRKKLIYATVGPRGTAQLPGMMWQITKFRVCCGSEGGYLVGTDLSLVFVTKLICQLISENTVVQWCNASLLNFQIYGQWQMKRAKVLFHQTKLKLNPNSFCTGVSLLTQRVCCL